MYAKSFPKSSRRGSILPLAMILITIILVAGVGMLTCGVQARVYASRTADGIAAQTAADAGLISALHAINLRLAQPEPDNELPQQTDSRLANSYATFTYQVEAPIGTFDDVAGTDETDDGDDDSMAVRLQSVSRYTIQCTGRSGVAEKTVYATVRLKGLFESAILSRGRISLMPNTSISGYNSEDPTDTDIDVKIGTVSTEADQIPLGPGTVVSGDIFVGVGADPDEVIGPGGTVTGQKFALTEPVTFPVVTMPQLQDHGTVISAKGDTVTFGPADSGEYSEIELSAAKGNPGVLEIDGGKVVLHLTGNINLGNSAEIIIRDDSSLVLYVDGDIAMGNSAGFVNENPLGTTLKIFATGPDLQTFELKAKSNVFGVVYAPNADVELYPKAELYGAITANNVWIKSEGAFYYDEALRNVDPDDEGARFVIEKWWE